MVTMSRKQYADMFGPTVGDRVRLADTNLVIEVEKDYNVGYYGDESVYGGGKTVRDGMGSAPGATHLSGALDMVITNVVVVDPVLGVVKGDIGIREGMITGIGKSGNPHTENGVDPRLVIGPGTEVLSGEHMIATPGAIDSHVHLISPQQVKAALSNGITTLIGGGVGPSDGSRGTTCTPGPWGISRMLQAFEALPINIGLMAKGNASRPEPLSEQLLAGACALKVHEDWGSTSAVIDNALTIAATSCSGRRTGSEPSRPRWSRAARSTGRRWATRTPRCRRRSRSTTGRRSGRSARRCPRRTSPSCRGRRSRPGWPASWVSSG